MREMQCVGRSQSSLKVSSEVRKGGVGKYLSDCELNSVGQCSLVIVFLQGLTSSLRFSILRQ